jgi:inosine-uridine nucleoside N-ribohydrolase
MKKIKLIVDTDIGNDCDDAAALALLNRLSDKGDAELIAMTSCTSRYDGAGIIEIINKWYGKEIPVGMFKTRKFLDNKPYGNYSRAVCEKYSKYKKTDNYDNAVNVLRKALYNQTEKITLCCIGPLNNIAELLKSEPDDIPLSGIELVKQKVDKLFIMGGAFESDNKINEFLLNKTTEWNIGSDIESAQTTVELCETEIIFVPYEVGIKVKTGEKLLKGADSPIKLSYQNYANCPRESWDPITAYISVYQDNEYFKYSEYGTVEIDKHGITHFNKGIGKHRYIKSEFDADNFQKFIDDLIF